jgi:V8-like Glu-specific endopeptidase
MHVSRLFALAALAVVAVLVLAPVAQAERRLLTSEEIARIKREAVPMPFPDISTAVVTDEPVRWVYAYNQAERPPLSDMYSELPPPAMTAGSKAGGPTRITNTTQFPYSSVVHLYMKFGGGYAGCSGAFIKNTSTVFTAGHCVYSHEKGGYAEEIIVIPAQDADDTPFGQAYAYNFASNTGWVNNEDYTKDYAVIQIEPFSPSTSYMASYYSYDASWYYEQEFQTAGYPGAEGYTGDQMWWGEDSVDEVYAGMMRVDFHFSDYPYFCIPGQSGSPMYFNDGGTWTIAAVLTLASCHGVRINGTIDAMIDEFDCDGCVADNHCYDAGEVNPSNVCEICKPAQDPYGWSANNGESCDDGKWCNGDDTCEGGSCSQHFDKPCDADEQCIEADDQCIPAGSDDDDVSDDDTGSADDDDNDTSGANNCQELVAMIYEQCGFKLREQGQPVPAQDAYDWCEDNYGPWACIAECAVHEDVQSCEDFGACLNSACGVALADGGDDDDDDDDSSSGCGV